MNEKGSGKGMSALRVRSVGRANGRVLRAPFNRVAVVCLVVVLYSVHVRTGGVRADEPSGLAAAVALQDVVVAAIARSEKSVVSIARVADKGNGLADVQPNFFNGRQGLGGQQGPHDPEFVPTAFATGVVLAKA